MANPVLANRYEVKQQLGQTPSKRTLLAIDLKTTMPVVIKIVALDDQLAPDDIKLFEREASTLQALSHPSIPAYLDHFELTLRNGKGFALVQTFIDGKSLDYCIQSGFTFQEAQVKAVARSLLKILVYLHQQHPPVIHRDIKPSNILLTLGADQSLQQAYLIDFGSVQNFTDQSNDSFTVVGTYGYTPPEQLGGRAIMASDIYSLGATLIALITKTHPSSLPQAGMRIDFEKVTTLSPEFTQWLRLMTNPRIDQRFASARDALLSLDLPTVPRSGMPVPTKPTDCKIRLSKDRNTLEVVLPGLSGKTRLLIDTEKISVANEVLGLNFKQTEPANRRSISRLECIKRIDGKGQVVIWAGTQRFELGADGSITEPEMTWLAYEVGNWLGIPVKL